MSAKIVARSIIGAVAAVVLAAVIIPMLFKDRAGLGGGELSAVQREIVRLSNETNKRLPMQVDAETVLVTTTPQTGNALMYHYKLPNVTAGELRPGFITEALKPAAVAGYKTKMQNIRDLGISLIYQYSDKNGNLLESFTIGPND
jgi:hypothetical protein